MKSPGKTKKPANLHLRAFVSARSPAWTRATDLQINSAIKVMVAKEPIFDCKTVIASDRNEERLFSQLLPGFQIGDRALDLIN